MNPRIPVRLLTASTALLAVVAIGAPAAHACTRILWNDNDQAVLASRSMDWEPDTSDPMLVVSPRGLSRSGDRVGARKVADPNPLTWKSRYGSVAVTAKGAGVADGMNEKGLAAHALWMNAADFGGRDSNRPGLNDGLWAQYILDRAATVEQAIALTEAVDITPVTLPGGLLVPLSLAVEDASGDSAILQYVNGDLTVFHGPQYRVMSNDPPYAQALALVDPNGHADATRLDVLPGNTNSADRFVRASFYLDFLRRTSPRNLEEAKASLMSVARNVSDPIGAPMDTPGSVDETDYRTLADLTNLTYTYEPTRRLGFLVTDLTEIDFSAGQPVRVLDPTDRRLQGDVTNRYRPGTTTRR
ncbi:MAG: linear amide C-N hydrolase [Candidatus Nanopelagicales bacterium]|nr:linear amide C-N hydrolase [Candidatus Nanopelagicales bacterium]MCF8537949.1 linear amide C-N hydrolase [Candidatus Nanopelagicales bacterium]MCF8543059.1 linear amide C-N hydrolase [Candidatus Nanopelagicales bacterium]MCF8556236.1 linear amide C-N hydrolase [Candidatus Nanopelagicales bacterium]